MSAAISYGRDVPFSSQLTSIMEILQDFPCIMLITPLMLRLHLPMASYDLFVYDFSYGFHASWE